MKPVFDAETNARKLAMLNNAFATLYILPWLRWATLDEVIALWHAEQAKKPQAQQLALLGTDTGSNAATH